jgi:hypothetical protein
VALEKILLLKFPFIILKILTNLEFTVKNFSPASYLPVLGENETFNNDNDVSGIKSFFSYITDFQKKKKRIQF